MSSDWSYRLYFLVLILLMIASCSSLPDEFPAFDFTVDDVFTGEEIHLADFKGKPVVIYFFASW